ncbi:DUF1327 domain-containing protein [Salmonella enterica]|uniref:DUF1327 domain-containing protein n=1 Tax=Salmonella enterica subsp. enterica serovar Poona TaxID=436295 RepID=A0A5V6NLC7_SALET|nr:DUF1327 domain-containing protein [Salmonella enterica subsp. enterica serovar Irumu]EAN0330430.1 DUF1327 domain-containing protein [Salmonella enterica]EBS4388085.1 hypothetical protein [Salmonella enterica subsp. enterica serovar Panama]EBS4765741.1 hypothetical protein [Salmonella enterica subsp. enterica serovar Poona]EAO7825896.1 DUF1327 domain-containing protein [Salmonella enterica]
MTQNYELIVKGIRNFDNEVKVILILKDKERFASVFDLHIDIERQEGATLEFYEAEAKKHAKTFFLELAEKLCEGDEQSQGKCLCSEERYTIQINNAYNTILSEKDDIESRIEKLENSVVELNKKLSVLMPSEDEKKRRDEQFAAFYDYCIEVTRRNFVKIFEESKSLQ